MNIERSLEPNLGLGTLSSNIFGQLLNEKFLKSVQTRLEAVSEPERRLRAAFQDFLKASREDLIASARLSNILADLDTWLAEMFEKYAPLEEFAKGKFDRVHAFTGELNQGLFHHSRWPLFTVIVPRKKSNDLAFLAGSGLPITPLTDLDKFFAEKLDIHLCKFHAPPHRQALQEGLRFISNKLEHSNAKIVHAEGLFCNPPFPSDTDDVANATLRECRELLSLPLDETLGRQVTLAICDTGIDIKHPAFAKHISDKRLHYFVPNGMGSPDDRDPDYHGSHCAGIAAGSAAPNEGMAPGVNLVMARVFPPGHGGATNEMVKNGLRYALEKKADIISLSLGSHSGPESELAVICSEITRKDIALVVASAGNSGPTLGTVGAPASGEHVLAVGALDKYQKIASFSSRGAVGTVFEHLKKPSLTAIGVKVIAPKAGTDDYLPLSGTSMSCPMLAGLAAAKLSELRKAGKDCTTTELKNLCLASCNREGLKDDNDQPYATNEKYNPDVGAGLPRGLVKSATLKVNMKQHMTRGIILMIGIALGYGLGIWSSDSGAPNVKAYRAESELPSHEQPKKNVQNLEGLPLPENRTSQNSFENLIQLAEAGQMHAQYQVGLHYGHGNFGPIDLGAAEFWLNKAVESGHPDAPNALETVKLLRLKRVFEDIVTKP